MSMDTKRCTKCGEEKPATTEHFTKSARSKDGLHPRCKSCKNADNRELLANYRQDPEWLKRQRDNQAKLRSEEGWWYEDPRFKRAYDLKREFVMMKGGACEKCGYCHNLAALDFHHTDPANRKISINMNTLSKKNKEELLREEVKQCELLCANCHREEHHPTMLL